LPLVGHAGPSYCAGGTLVPPIAGLAASPIEQVTRL
jgi:hypothetical protein